MSGPWEKYQTAGNTTDQAADAAPATAPLAAATTGTQVVGAPWTKYQASTSAAPDQQAASAPTQPVQQLPPPAIDDVNAAPQPAPTTAPGILDKVSNFFTGADRETRATRELPELQNSGLLAGVGLSAAKQLALSATLATTYDPEEATRILKAVSPDIGVEQDEKGNYLVANNRTGARAVVNKPGFSEQDAIQAAGAAALFTPAGRAVGLVGGGLVKGAAAVGAASALTEAGAQAAQAAEGGSFDPADVALAGAGGVGGEILARGIGAIGSAARTAIASKKADAESLRTAYDSAVAAGEDPAVASQRLLGDSPPSTNETSAEAIANAVNARGKEVDGSIQALAVHADPDQNVLDAIQKLGITESPTIGQITRNQSYRENEQGLASLPGSPLNVQITAFQKGLSARADKLIADYGGSTDKSAFSYDFKDQSLDAIKDLEKQSSDLYGQVDKAIPANAPAPADSALAYLKQKIASLNGDPSLLPAPELKAYRALSADPDVGKPLVSVAGLKVPERHAATAQGLSQEADSLITDLGGNFDKSEFSDVYKAQQLRSIEDLAKQSTDLYRQVNNAIPKGTPAPADATLAYLKQRLQDTGGKEILLSPGERKALEALSPIEQDGIVRQPPYSALDIVRRQVGAGYKGRGDFADADDRELDALYSALSQDQQRVVAGAGPDVINAFTQAKALVAQRKGIEQGVNDTIGKDLSGSIGNKLGASLKSLANGDFQAFDRTIANVPDGLKQRAAATALSDTLTGGKGKSLNIPAFTALWSNLSKNVEAKARFTSLLPQEAVQRLDNLATRSQHLHDTVNGSVPDGALRTPSYRALDAVRQEIQPELRSQSPLHGKAGKFDDLHSALLSDQQRAADSHGVGEAFSTARILEAQRNHAHSNLTDLLGKDFSEALTVKLGSSIERLKEGNFAKFDQLVDKIPVELRQKALVTVLNDVFTAGGRSSVELTAPGFTKWYAGITRNAAAKKRFFEYMPAGLEGDLDNMNTVARSVAAASDAKIPNGRIEGLLKSFTTNDGVIARIWDVTRQAGLAEALTSAIGLHGAGATSVLAAKLAARKSIPIGEKASKFLASEQFQSAIKAFSVAGGSLRANVLAREKQLMRTHVYKNWLGALGHAAAARVALVGPIAYLTEQKREH